MGIKQIHANPYRKPAKEIGGMLLDNPTLIKIHELDQRKVTIIAWSMALMREEWAVILVYFIMEKQKRRI